MTLPTEDESPGRFELPPSLAAHRGPDMASPPPPGEEPDAAERLFPVVWNLLRVVCFAGVLVLMVPQVLTLLGGADAYRWIRSHAWVRWASVPVLFPLMLITALEPLKSRRVGESDDDPALGPAPGPPAGFDPFMGFLVGDPQRWSVEGRAVEAGTWSARKQRRFIATAKLPSTSGFAFGARDPRSEPAWMRGLAQQAIRMGVEQARMARPEMAASADAMEFLSRDPAPLPGHPLAGGLLLRSNDPDRAATLFADGDVVNAIQSLANANALWSVSLLPDGADGGTVLRFECPCREASDARDETVRALLSAILRRLDLGASPGRERSRNREVA